jgi:hypothetical protein
LGVRLIETSLPAVALSQVEVTLRDNTSETLRLRSEVVVSAETLMGENVKRERHATTRERERERERNYCCKNYNDMY